MAGLKIPRELWDLNGIPEPSDMDNGRSIIWNKDTKEYEYADVIIPDNVATTVDINNAITGLKTELDSNTGSVSVNAGYF